MNPLTLKYRLFIRSSFAPRQKADLYDYICRNYRRRIEFYVSQIVPRGHGDYQDVCQEVMVKIYNHLDGFDPGHSFKAWVYQIVRHQCLDLVKSREEKQRRLRQGDPDLVNSGPAADPEQRVMRQELMESIDRAVSELPPLEREICYLRFYEGLKYREIGQVVGLDVDAVKAKIHALKAGLRRRVGR